MPRSSKHKSSKHSSRDTREYSDSEKDSNLKDRKGKDENVVKVSKDSSSSEKRKLETKDGKDVQGSGNGEHSEEYGSSKRRKERTNDRVGDRWNGGDEDRGEGSRKSKTSGDSKSRRRDESVGVYGESEELKKSNDKSDGKHKDSSRKESREGGAEKDRKFKEGRSERSVDNEEQRMPKKVFENTDLRGLEELQSLELDNQLERRMRKKRNDFGGWDKHQDVGDGYDRRLSSRDDSTKDGRQKDEKRKDEKYRGKYREETDREKKCRHDKPRDEPAAKDHTSNRTDYKHAREEKDNVDSRQKRTKLLESDHDRGHNRDGDQDLESSHDHDYELDRDCDYNRDRDYDHDRDRDGDHDGSHTDDRSARSKESGGKKRTLDGRDDYSDTKSGVFKIHYSDGEKRSLNSSRTDSNADRGRSQPQQAHADSIGTSGKRRPSPTSNTHTGKDEYRNVNSEDLVFRDSMIEQRTKGLREGLSGMSERGLKYNSMENPIKTDDGPAGDLPTERSSSSKASPVGLVERTSSSLSIERKNVNRSGVRQNLEIKESGWRNSVDARDFSAFEDRLGGELTLEKPLLDEFSQADSSYYGRISHGNASLIPPPTFRPGLDRPFINSLEDEVRDNSNPRYRRSSDSGFGRGHSNSWRGVPNWTLPVPNGFVPFQHGPTHGGFQAMIPQFPSQPLFGVRPPMDVNHAGVPYHIPAADRFSGHMLPLGWQNMMDGTGPSHFHGWDGNNGVFRDDPHMYDGSDWDRNRHSTNTRGWESGSDAWKEQNGDLKDLPSPACKDESVPFQGDDDLSDQAIQMSQDECNWGGVHDKTPETKSSGFSSPEKAPMNSSPLIMLEKLPDTLTTSDNTYLFGQVYLSKLDISAELALPELYEQFMCLLNVEKNACIDSDASTDLFLKNGSRVWQKYTATLSKSSPFPAIDSSIFQRAIDLYKKQMVELPNGGKVDIISGFKSNQVQLDEPVLTPHSENMQVSVSTDDARANMPTSTLDMKKVETLSPPTKEHLEESDQTLGQKGQDHVFGHSLKLAMCGPSDHENQGEPLADLAKEDDVTSKRVILGNMEENRPIAVINESKLVSTMNKGGDNLNSISKAKITGFSHCADEKLGFGDTMGGPLIFEEGTLKDCDALMPGSNESESLILSRIHHSPESTH